MRPMKSIFSSVLVCTLFTFAAQAADPNNMAAPSDLPPARSSADPAPPVPSPIIGRQLHLVRQAGRGGQTAYAREGVLEMGGGMSLASATDYFQMTITPSIGFFLTNNFKLSVQSGIAYSRVGGKRNYAHPTFVTILVTPSFHLPINDTVFAYGALGVGAGYLRAIGYQAPKVDAATGVTTDQGGLRTRDHGWGFAAQPELGLNVLLGRSGILSPFVNVTLATNKLIKTDGGSTAVALNTIIGAGFKYSIMW